METIHSLFYGTVTGDHYSANNVNRMSNWGKSNEWLHKCRLVTRPYATYHWLPVLRGPLHGVICLYMELPTTYTCFVCVVRQPNWALLFTTRKSRPVKYSVFIALSFFPFAPTLEHRASVKRLVSLQFLNPKTVGRTPWMGDEPVARPLPIKTQTNIHAFSGIRMHDPSVRAGEDRQRGHCRFRKQNTFPWKGFEQQ
jgi:hypothetical protein